MPSHPHIYLASGSPRRRALLAQIGITFQTVRVAVDETPLSGEHADTYVARLALAKARAGWAVAAERPARPVLGADTSVVLEDRILGKPRNRKEALGMLAALSGRQHRVLSAVAVVRWQDQSVRVQSSRVVFRPLTPAERDAYWATGEPVDKAGGYAIQGYAAAFIEHLEGSYSGVMGLPLFETAELLREYGINSLQAPSKSGGNSV
jgi:septum formation protein